VERDLRAAGLIARGRDLGDYFIQGAYHPGFEASGATHGRGGVIDLDPALATRKGLKILRRWGLAAWHRPAGSVSSIDHIHCVLVGSDRLTPAAARQIRQYRAGFDGLGNPDAGPRMPVIRPWHEILREARE
jgi:hypothetical protein